MSNMKTTKCLGCGKDMKYLTKRPSRCTECKTKKKTAKKKGYNFRSKTSNGERNMFYLLNDIITGYEYINSGYYSFLLSPKGAPLQLDRYYPDLKLAFEYDGDQHDKYVKYIQKNKDNFDYQQQCDAIKDKTCKKLGITLIRVKQKEKVTPALLREKIKESNKRLYKKLLQEGSIEEE